MQHWKTILATYCTTTVAPPRTCIGHCAASNNVKSPIRWRPNTLWESTNAHRRRQNFQWDFQEYHKGEILASNRELISFKGVAMDVTMATALDVAMNMAMTIGHDATSHTAARLIIYPWSHGYYHGQRCVRHGRQHGHNHANDRDHRRAYCQYKCSWFERFDSQERFQLRVRPWILRWLPAKTLP